jgi:hypothetical protein
LFLTILICLVIPGLTHRGSHLYWDAPGNDSFGEGYFWGWFDNDHFGGNCGWVRGGRMKITMEQFRHTKAYLV